ncbi:MAG: AAA family ATPase, partial [Candidatus Hydrogenedentes bacterium]|nr:AAA family ATPase [Candidatus Hydrogenedentota bacterium]
MARVKVIFVCQTCGAVHPRWMGKCTECEEWNTIVEEQAEQEGAHLRPAIVAAAEPVAVTDGTHISPERLSPGVGECDRVLGGGIVAGSLTLVGGDPGIGKSTLMLQISHHVAQRGGRVLYVTGEESFNQARLRAD